VALFLKVHGVIFFSIFHQNRYLSGKRYEIGPYPVLSQSHQVNYPCTSSVKELCQISPPISVKRKLTLQTDRHWDRHTSDIRQTASSLNAPA